MRPRGVGTVLTSKQEASLVSWVNDLRVEGLPISTTMLQLKAQEVAAAAGIPPGRFTASQSWRDGFLKRNRLSFRARTHQGQMM
ncbi:TPA: hypothetical protein N0F65_012282 [Lagenidium giganteum]|uniref:HTH CENPB-type domain-containing protein n=1 Tax=Lagenidium giganteum TaxID=4803 RepID=A0AAV2ZJ14_9STRA|nr:TPA: hypothetical protein N0F65_012282 [Lagenidium giganteum]